MRVVRVRALKRNAVTSQRHQDQRKSRSSNSDEFFSSVHYFYDRLLLKTDTFNKDQRISTKKDRFINTPLPAATIIFPICTSRSWNNRCVSENKKYNYVCSPVLLGLHFLLFIFFFLSTFLSAHDGTCKQKLDYTRQYKTAIKDSSLHKTDKAVIKARFYFVLIYLL